MVKLKSYIDKYREILIFSDITILIFSYIACLLVFKSLGKIHLDRSPYENFLIFLFPIIWIFALSLRGFWSLKKITKLDLTIYSIFESGILSLLIFSTISFSLKDAFPRSFVYSCILIINTILVINRFLLYEFHFKKLLKNSSKGILFIGNQSEISNGIMKLSELNIEPDSVFHLNFEEYKNETDLFIEITRILKSGSVNFIYLSESAPKSGQIINKISQLYIYGLVSIYMESKITHIISRIVKTDKVDLLEIIEPSISDSGKVSKRMLDIFVSLISLVILSPIFILTFVLIKLSSRGPALYISTRLGQNNKTFIFPKFRTMHLGAEKLREEVLGSDLTQIKKNYKKDPRITLFGRFLRRWSVDEIPQFWSVLKGDMSIVGPRPILLSESELVGNDQSFRFIAKPGLTGLWQVEGRKEIDWDERMNMEIRYIETWSLLGDLHLILRTIFAIISGRGAY